MRTMIRLMHLGIHRHLETVQSTRVCFIYFLTNPLFRRGDNDMLKILARIGGNKSEIQDYNSNVLKFENVKPNIAE